MTKFKKMITVPIDVYGKSVIVFYNYSNKEIAKAIKNKPIIAENQKDSFVDLFEKDEESAKGLYVGNGYSHVITIEEDLSPKSLINTVAHEVLHMVFGLTRYVAIKTTEDAEEAFTYLMGYLMGEIYDKLIVDILASQKQNLI